MMSMSEHNAISPEPANVQYVEGMECHPGNHMEEFYTDNPDLQKLELQLEVRNG
jgi:hypothetical protein